MVKFKLKFGAEEALFIAICAVVAVVLFSSFSMFERPNGPLIGGDVYQALGIVNYLNNGNSPFYDSAYRNTYAWYPWLWHYMVVFIHIITGFDFFRILVWLPLFLTIAFLYSYYRLGKALFGEFAGVLTAFFALFFTSPGTDSLVPVPVNLSYVILPWVLYFMYKYSTGKRQRDGICAGISLGLLGLTHVHTYVAAWLMMFVLSFLLVAFASFSRKPALRIPIERLKQIGLVLAIGFIISMLFWGPLIAKYHLVPTRSIESTLGFEGGSPPVFTKDLWGSTFGQGAFFVLGLLGAYSMYKSRRPQDIIGLAFLLSAYAGIFHFYVTYPLLGILFQPHKFYFVLGVGLSIAAAVGVKLVADALVERKIISQDKVVFVVLLFMLLLAPLGPMKYKENAFKDEWSAAEPVPPIFKDTADWISENTPKDAIIAANPLTAFMINALTGRGVVANEMGHSSPYSELERLTAEVNTIYMSTDEAEAYALLKENGAQYLVINIYELQYYAQSGGLDKFFNSPHYKPVAVFEYGEGDNSLVTAVLEVF
ncbi:MAG: hypothetical protein ABH829_03160 [archaeon]